MGIEPTCDEGHPPHNGFEDRGHHQVCRHFRFVDLRLMIFTIDDLSRFYDGLNCVAQGNHGFDVELLGAGVRDEIQSRHYLVTFGFAQSFLKSAEHYAS